MRIRPVEVADRTEWLRLRAALWPEEPAAELAADRARERGFAEIASDTELGNEASQRAHAALGFEEVERIVVFRKAL